MNQLSSKVNSQPFLHKEICINEKLSQPYLNGEVHNHLPEGQTSQVVTNGRTKEHFSDVETSGVHLSAESPKKLFKGETSHIHRNGGTKEYLSVGRTSQDHLNGKDTKNLPNDEILQVALNGELEKYPNGKILCQETGDSNGSLLRQLDWEEVKFDIGWGTVRGKKCGSGSRKLLAVHGWLDNANSFNLIAPLLPPNVTLLSLDLPGHGLSDHFPEGFIYDPRGYVAAVKKAVTAAGWRRFTYMGHSMGALVGIMYAAVFPEDVDSFISIDIIKVTSLGTGKYASAYKKYFHQYFDNEVKLALPPIVYTEKELVQKSVEISGSLDETCARILLQRGAKKSLDGRGLILTRDLRVKAFFIGFSTSEEWYELARAIQCPILIIKAKDGHVYASPEETEKMLNSFRDGCSHFVYRELDGKHHVHMTHPEEAGKCIVTFLADSSPYLLAGT